MIKKVKSGYRLVSKKTGRNLGTYSSKEGAINRERQVQYFKHMKEDGAPAMSAGSGNVAGIGVGKDGEPGVKMKKKYDTLLGYIRRKQP